MKGRPGPIEVTGKYNNRRELNAAVAELHDTGHMPKVISEITCVSLSTIHGILKKHREAKRTAQEKANKSLISRAWV